MTRGLSGARRLLALAALALLCGCDGGPHTDGRAVFRSACGGCHTLAGDGAPHPVGGDLGGYQMTAHEVETFTKIMPTRRRLSRQELEAVSAYVASIQRRR
jgi:mono/diheme cytochrome c family protein